MEGYPDPVTARGIIPNSFAHLFESINIAIANPKEGEIEVEIPHFTPIFTSFHTNFNFTPHQQYLVRASYLEVYNDDVRDLLSKNSKQALDLRESPETGVFVKDLISLVVKNQAGR
jgi:kinesin family protein 3/17